MKANKKPVKVAVLMATRNGAAYLDEQVQSLLCQTHPQIDLHVSDDGSTDETLRILQSWKGCWNKGKFVVVDGPRRGFAENFRSLIVDPAVEADYFAFCDQDDIWEPSKLETALSCLAPVAPETPALFCSRTLTITEAGEAVGASPLFAKEPSFRNALVQSLAGGNTMVLNRSAQSIMRQASIRSGFTSHDWWAYLLVSGAGGHVFYCRQPLVRYRQHGSNQVGANTSLGARFERLRRLVGGQFWAWSNENVSGLEVNADLLTCEAKEVLSLFIRAREGDVLNRLSYLRRSAVYRQTAMGDLGLYVAALINKL